MKKMLSILLALCLLLCGCQTAAPEETKQAAAYDWMAGECPIPQQRSGIDRQGISSVGNGFECTDDGVYFMLKGQQDGNYLYYGDHGSDTIVKLCGRPDCMHNDADCNAFVSWGNNICYYDGYLYTIQRSGFRNHELIRMELDGSNRISVVDTREVGTDYSGSSMHMIWNGIFSIGLIHLDENGDEVTDLYYYRLDGSMDGLEPANMGIPFGNDGNHFLVYSTGPDGNMGYSQWNPDTQEVTHLTDVGAEGYYGMEDAWYILDGVIYHDVYADAEPQAVFDTGLDGYKRLQCYPDCLVVSDAVSWEDQWKDVELETIGLDFYNWNFEHLGHVTLDYPRKEGFDDVICGETPDRIILTDSYWFYPRYYIEKSDFGTGNIELHEYNLPDLTEELAILDTELVEQREDEEWLDSN